MNQATRCTQKQLACAAYWQARGYTFSRDAVIPEDTRIAPDGWALSNRATLAASAVMLAIVLGILKVIA